MNVLSTEMLNKVLHDQKSSAWVEGQLVGLRSKLCRFKIVGEKSIAPHCSSGLLTLRSNLLGHLLKDLERFGSFLAMYAGRSEHSEVVVKKAYKMTSRRLSARV